MIRNPEELSCPVPRPKKAKTFFLRGFLIYQKSLKFAYWAPKEVWINYVGFYYITD